jgi:hypothetical protein
MMPSRISLGALTVVCAALLTLGFSTGCDESGYIVVERDPDKRQIGDACVLSGDCESGRCIGGVCEDTGCQSDDECLSNELCVFGECVPSDEFACNPGERPLLQVTPLDIEFGEVALDNTAEETVTLSNLGDCLLTLSGVGLESNGDPGFSCDLCDPSEFPQRIPPGRNLDVTVSFSPPGAGEAINRLLIRSDDETAGPEGLVAVGLHASYSGVPVLTVDPVELAFGYVPQNSSDTQTVRITNQGSGNAVLTLDGLFINNFVNFTISDEYATVSPTDPILLAPYDANDPATTLEIDVTFTPDALLDYASTLNIRAHAGDASGAVTATVELTGSAKGPPQITVDPLELVFQEADGSAIPVGGVTFEQVTITNSGQSDLAVELSLFDPSGDFSVSPPFLAPLPPGGAVPVTIFYNPSEPSDAVNPHDPQTPINASLNVTSNDTDPASDVLKTVALRGWARGGVFDDVLKLEMTYENADNSWAGNDFRDVDLELTSEIGFSCAKPIHQYGSCGPDCYEVISTTDLCQQWTDYGQLGTASWVALGQYEEPERVLLFGLGQDLANGQTFTARAHYIEDCANIPTGILGSILGIGGSILLGALGGAVGVPVAVDPNTISDLVTENCWDHESSLVTLHVYVNGDEVASPQYRLRDKGDCAELVKIRRENGQFIVENTNGVECN